MAVVDFRCEQCGKLLSVDAQAGSAIKCPHCHKKVTVPDALASFPHPHVSPAISAARPAEPVLASPPAMLPQQVRQEEQAPPSVLMARMAVYMPWLMSLFLHVGLGLILMFFGMAYVTVGQLQKAEVFIPGEDFSANPGGVVNPGDGGGARPDARQSVRKVDQATGFSSHTASIVGGSSASAGKQIALIGVGGGSAGNGGGLAKFGIGSGGKSGPRAAFFGRGTNAHHILYVIDRSGSMAAGNVFGDVANQMRISIGKLNEVQDFHIIFFSEGPPIELPGRRLAPANRESKAAAANFLDDVIPSGQTDPLPALKRAFEVMRRVDERSKGKQMFLLTDGAFKDNQAVLNFIRSENKNKDVHIMTYLYGKTDDQEIIKTMSTIAAENGGLFKNIVQE